MRFPWSPRPKADEPPPPSLFARLADVEAQLRSLQRDLDDLDERFGSFKGRVSKREGLSAVHERTNGGANPAVTREGKLDVLAIRRGPRVGPAGGSQ